MKKLWILGILLILLININACSTQSPETFKVKYYSVYSSSGGDRVLDIIYTVNNGEIISCEGTYSYSPTQAQRDSGDYSQNVEQCDIGKLKAKKEYIGSSDIITEISKNQDMKGEVNDGRYRYNWEITIIK